MCCATSCDGKDFSSLRSPCRSCSSYATPPVGNPSSSMADDAPCSVLPPGSRNVASIRGCLHCTGFIRYCCGPSCARHISALLTHTCKLWRVWATERAAAAWPFVCAHASSMLSTTGRKCIFLCTPAALYIPLPRHACKQLRQPMRSTSSCQMMAPRWGRTMQAPNNIAMVLTICKACMPTRPPATCASAPAWGAFTL